MNIFNNPAKGNKQYLDIDLDESDSSKITETEKKIIDQLLAENTEQKQLIKELVRAIEAYDVLLQEAEISGWSLRPQIGDLLTRAKAHV